MQQFDSHDHYEIRNFYFESMNTFYTIGVLEPRMTRNGCGDPPESLL